ncbi:hypothetical protein CLF_110334 [Clonorchis sinensis]|uniref:Integrase catalytic domain-containing protein n=1 Tax=Clonorchis sinensis TaxID=79923 RepID=G7YTF3_CLOSI|nr:hypothetical protein CLF_110334 [Clonorchis sinensis]
MEYHQSSWPTTCPSGELRKLFQRRSSLSVVSDCLLFGDRIVIPTELRQRVLAQFHSGHPGISRMKALAHSYVYWPGMDEHMEQVCRSCFRCSAAQKLPNRQSPQPWPQPAPWSRIHVDFAGPIDGQSFLIVVDAFSKWPEVLIMSEITTMATITKLRHLFSIFGILGTIVSDNGTQFTSHQFGEFARRHGITHVTSPSFHPQSNGQAKRFIDTYKRALTKAEGITTEVLDTFLLNYRATANPQSPD